MCKSPNQKRLLNPQYIGYTEIAVAWPCMRVQVFTVMHGHAHQEKSTHLAWSGTSGTSGMSGGFSCQKFLSSHFFSELLYSHNYIRIFILSQSIHKFIPSRIFTRKLEFCSSSFKLRHMWPCWLMFNFLHLRRLSLTIITYVALARKHCLCNKSAYHLTTTPYHHDTVQWRQQKPPKHGLTIARACSTREVWSCCLFLISPSQCTASSRTSPQAQRTWLPTFAAAN